jgi:uncharacterized protein YqeY
MLIDEIKKANLMAMKEHNADKRAAYSMVISRYQGLLTSGKGGEIKDEDVIAILMKFSKELEEEALGYKEAGREDSYRSTLAQKEAVALFLPKLLSEEEIKEIIAGLEDKSVPGVMKHFKANYAGKADMSLVSKIARGA